MSIVKKITEAVVPKAKQQYADCIIYNEFGEVLLLHRIYGDDFAAGKWGFPGGHIEEGEDPKTACEREVLEETGLSVTALPVMMKDLPKAKIHYFEATIQKNDILLSADEHRGMEWVAVSEIKNKDLIADLSTYVEELLKITEWNTTELEQMWKIITDAFDNDMIQEDQFLKARQQYLSLKRHSAFQLIKKGFDLGIIDEKRYLQAHAIYSSQVG